MREMVGGCCVCSDERGWPENPLVYCDGPECQVAVHQACYGIVTVPTGPWFCRKCESDDRDISVECELCPAMDGALKRTDTQAWAHVVCALYIPEVRFGNVTTMEPIILQLIPQERYGRECYICEDNEKARIGACMQCNKTGCKTQFHVTCAQTKGLLCEEAGNYLDNVKYCGYCEHHYSRLKKNTNVKAVPPFKPSRGSGLDRGSCDPSSSPENEANTTPTSAVPASVATTSGSTPKSSGQGGNSSNNNHNGSSNSSNNGNTNNATGSTVSTATAPAAGPISNTSGSSSTHAHHSHHSHHSHSSSAASKQRKVSSRSSSKSSSSTGGAGGGGGASAAAGGGGGGSTSGSSTGSTHAHSVNNSHSGNIANNTTDGSIKEKDRSSKGLSKSSSSSSSSSSSRSKEIRDRHHSSRHQSSRSSGSSNSSANNKDGHTVKDVTSSAIVTNAAPVPKDHFSSKFTTSNFTETIVVNSGSVFSADSKSTNHTASNAANVKKRKLESSGKSASTDDGNKDMIKDVSVTLVPLPFDKLDASADSKKQKVTEVAPLQPVHSNVITNHSMGVKPVSTGSILQPSALSKYTTSEPSNLQAPVSSFSAGNPLSMPIQPVSLVVSVPLTTANTPTVQLPSSIGGINTSHVGSIIKPYSTLSTESNAQNVSTHRLHVLNPVAQLETAAMIEKQNNLIKISTPSPNVNKLADNLSGHIVSPNTVGTNGNTSTTTITTMESGGLKITYEKQPQPSISVKGSQDDVSASSRISCTPDDSMNNSNSFSGLKFSFEAQANSYTTPSQTPDIKESPPSSPGSEIGSRKRPGAPTDAKDFKIFQKNVHATHMLGNQLNPASSMAQKMSDQLYMEMEAHSVYNAAPSLETGTPLVGPAFPGKQLNVRRNNPPAQSMGPSLSSMLGGTGTPTASGSTPASLEQLLERQWEQGSQFLMEQAQHFDIASLLSCLYQLRTENIRLEDHVNNLIARRDHLLAVNARLAIPLGQTGSGPPPGQAPNSFSNHLNGPTEAALRRPVENQNCIDFRHAQHQINQRFDVINNRNKTDNR